MRTPEMKTQSPSGSRGRAGLRISNLPPWLSLLCMVVYIKGKSTMQIGVPSTLTVYHVGQFCVGLAERAEIGLHIDIANNMTYYTKRLREAIEDQEKARKLVEMDDFVIDR